MTKRIKFPQFTNPETIRLIYSRCANSINQCTDGELCRYLDIGRFVFAWDGENPADTFPVVGALRSVTKLPFNKSSIEVITEEGYSLHYEHAVVIDEADLPLLVSIRDKKNFGLGMCDSVGAFVGVYEDPVCGTSCVICQSIGGGNVIAAPENVAFLTDVNFGIVKEENNENS